MENNYKQESNPDDEIEQTENDSDTKEEINQEA